MQDFYFFLLLVAVPILFFVAVWAVVTTCRLVLRHRSLPIAPKLFAARWERSGPEETVGVQEIHAAHRRREHQRQRKAPVYYLPNEPASRLPDEWIDDLWKRRN